MTTSTFSIEPSAPPSWRAWLAYVTMALMPLSINAERIVGPMKSPMYVSPLDFLLPVLAILMLIDLLQRKPWAQFKFPQAATILWSVLAIASVLWIDGTEEKWSPWAKAAANPTFVVMIGVWAFSNITHSAAEFRKLALILCGSFALCILYAFYQYIGPVGIPYDPNHIKQPLGGVTNLRLGGWYDNRMLFGAQVAMLVPVAAAFAAFDRDPLVKAVCAVLALLALSVTLSAGGFLGAVAGVVAVAAACMLARNWIAGFAILATLFIFVAVVLPHLPEKRNNIATLSRGVTLWAKVGDDKKIATPRVRRYQAILSYLSSHRNPMDEKTLPNWVLGAGAGRLNTEVSKFYDDAYYPRTDGRTDDEALFDTKVNERDGFGLVETTALQFGAAGLMVLGLFFAAWIFGAAGAFARGASSDIQVLALAALGAGVGAMIVSLFSFPSQRGAGSGGTFAFFAALSAWTYWRSSEPKKSISPIA